MKTTCLILAVALCASLALPTIAQDTHAPKQLATPKGGRLLDKTAPSAEFVIEQDRTVSINFYNAEMKPVAVTTQTVTVQADAQAGKVKLEFEQKGDSLVSQTPLPAGDGYNIVVQFKQTAAGKPMNLRFKLDLHPCGECQRAEYACACGH